MGTVAACAEFRFPYYRHNLLFIPPANHIFHVFGLFITFIQTVRTTSNISNTLVSEEQRTPCSLSGWNPYVLWGKYPEGQAATCLCLCVLLVYWLQYSRCNATKFFASAYSTFSSTAEHITSTITKTLKQWRRRLADDCIYGVTNVLSKLMWACHKLYNNLYDNTTKLNVQTKTN